MSETPVVGTPTVNSKWRLDVDTSATSTPSWVQVKGVTSFQPSVASTIQDASDFDSAGWGADAVTQRKWSNVCTVGRKIYGTAFDVGQEELRAAADDLALVHVRWYERGNDEGEAYEGYALVQWEPQGGDATALSTVNVTLLGQGERTEIAHPEAPVTP